MVEHSGAKVSSDALTGSESVSILVKSARRPWALDRLLDSLQENLVSWGETRIHVVDDRTEKKFLEKLQSKFPCVEFSSADPGLVQKKTKDLAYVSAWRAAVSKLETEYVFVLEDDQWLISPLDLRAQVEVLSTAGARSIFLSTGIDDFEGCVVAPLANGSHYHYFPNLLHEWLEQGNWVSGAWVAFLTQSGWVGRKLVSLATLSGISRVRQDMRSLALINPMCGAIYRRADWLHNWAAPMENINESKIIRRIVKSLANSSHPNRTRGFLTMPTPLIRTTYVSSISWRLGLDVDWELFNLVWSECWARDELPKPEGFEDWSPEELAHTLLVQVGLGAESAYRAWVQKFRALHGVSDR